jgi:hypothetical protein
MLAAAHASHAGWFCSTALLSKYAAVPCVDLDAVSRDSYVFFCCSDFRHVELPFGFLAISAAGANEQLAVCELVHISPLLTSTINIC